MFLLFLRRSVGWDWLGPSRVFSVLRWMTLKKDLGVGAVRHLLYMAAKAPGVDPARRCLVLSLQ
jgi:hypothetical protein